LAKLKPKELAQQAALQGEVEFAVEQFTLVLEGGDVGAAASLAEIAAFRAQWADVLRYAYQFMRKPDAVYAGNVLGDIAALVAVAGFKAGGWSAIHSEVKAIRAALLKDKKLAKYVDGADWLADRVNQLLELAHNEGKGRFSLDTSDDDELTEDARAAKFDAAVETLEARPKKPYKDELGRKRHFFTMAWNYGSHRSAMRLYDEEGGTSELASFGPIAFTASALARAGRASDSWKVVEEGLALWRPVDLAQIAPVVLLTDPHLRELLTTKRSEWVLSTPRGAAATTKKK
jgi:hypothetical protein